MGSGLSEMDATDGNATRVVGGSMLDASQSLELLHQSTYSGKSSMVVVLPKQNSYVSPPCFKHRTI